MTRQSDVLSAMRPARRHRSGKILALFALALPATFAFAGLVIDGGNLLTQSRTAQHAADAAATAAAMSRFQGKTTGDATLVAERYVKQHNGLPDAQVTCHMPPATGPYAGKTKFVEVIVDHPVETHLIHVFGGQKIRHVKARAVAGCEDSTAPSALVVLDPSPAPLTVPPIPLLLPPAPVLLGGIEILGLGALKVDGAVLVNTEWGHKDEKGRPAGTNAGPPWGISCTPLVNLTKLRARDIRVVGGVDNHKNYGNFSNGKSSPLRANRRPVPDPYADLPVPTMASGGANISNSYYGGKTIVGIPLITPPTVLHPGVYDYITIVSGRVIFEPGIYIIRGKHPVTQMSLSLVVGQVTAEGVMFYITDSPGYSPNSGAPDNHDGETEPATPGVLDVLPSAVLNIGLLGSRFSPLNAPGSPYNGLLLYQRRADRRPIVIVQENLLPGTLFTGRIYAKWAHVILAGIGGTYDASFVCGSFRSLVVTDVTLAPSNPLPPAQDVFLVE